MKLWIIHATPKRLESLVWDRGQRVRAALEGHNIFYTPWRHEIKVDIEKEFHSGETYYADTEDVAVEVADWLAKNKPGVEVTVAKVVGVSIAPVGEPKVRKVTEKGILPE